MSNAQLSPTAQKVLELLRKNKGMPYGASDVCEVADCSTGQADVALTVLADAGLIERQQSAFGTTTYIARK
jgi:DNA-binding MarR family transcriptional regulator